MRKSVLLTAILIIFVICELFAFSAAKDCKQTEKDSNENYTEYEAAPDDYIVTTGTITDIIEAGTVPEEQPLAGGTDYRMCIIKFETSDGRSFTDFFFPSDSKKDKVGRNVEIAYKPVEDSMVNTVIATRTEYIPNTIPIRNNLILRIVFGVGIAVSLVLNLRAKS
ncbi:hypothetical protein [Ruminococcus albus]|uniref:Uncharacterized protein n=1 Tax=Ruminococcus albus TaxID=1264 RepID=A0A1I1Q785_RUMAL|nr:hypothetical protein [Ruminococcus albus]SFD15728.1 hypothetical protein SAMN02910406_03257 [Ruminococcus albus]